MSDNPPEPSDLLERLIWLVSTPEGHELWKSRLRAPTASTSIQRTPPELGGPFLTNL